MGSRTTSAELGGSPRDSLVWRAPRVHDGRVAFARRFGPRVTSIRVAGLLLAGLAAASSCSGAHHPSAKGSTALSTALGDPQHRPLHFPHLSPTGQCPITTGRSQPTAALGVMLGHGAVRPIGWPDGVLHYVAPSDDPLNAFRGSVWGGNKVLWAVGPTVHGDVLIRGRQLDGSGGLRFGMGVIPDPQLLLRAADTTADAAGWRGYPSETRVQHRGCYGYQIDTAATSTTVVLSVE